MNKLNFVLKCLIVFIFLIVFLVFSTLWYFSAGLPNYKKLSNYSPPISSRVYSDQGKLIAEYALEKRLFIPYETIPEKVINSFLSAEDKNFFNHPGVDAKGILRATINNVKNVLNDKRLEGASTITQQVAKNFLLTNEVSLKRKIKEAILAIRIEKAFSKERILELYLNQIYLGEGTYGIAAASLEYFDKSVKDLNYEESALLAALPKAPSRYNPYRYYDTAVFRRNLVLNNLYNNNFITKKEFEVLKEKKIKLKKKKIEIINEANSYTEEVRRAIKNKYGFEKLYTQGLSIRSPLNIEYQIQAIKALRNGIENYDRRNGWRGEITNKYKNKNWKKKITDIKLDPTLQWKIAEIISIENNKLNIQIYNGDKYCTRLSMNNYIHSICDCLKFYYHIDKGVHIQLLIENNEGYIKISNLSSSVLQNNATIEQLIFKKLLSNNSTINNSSNNGNNNFSIGGGSSLVDIYVLDSNFTAKETVDIDLAYKNHAYKIHQLKIPNINANLRIVREIIYGITLKNDEGDGSGGNKDPGDDSSSDEDSENDDNDFDYDDDLHHRKNHAEIIKYKYQIFSKLNQKETYHFSHQGINIEQDQEIHTGAIEVAIDEGCLETYNGVVQSEELILLINDE